MEATDDRGPASAGNPLRLDLSAVRDSPQLERRDGSPFGRTQELNVSHSSAGKHGRFRVDYFTKGPHANASAEREVVELMADAADSENHWTECDDSEVSHLLRKTGPADIVSTISEHSRTIHVSNTARDSSVKSDSQCGSSNSGLGNASNSAANNSKYLNSTDKTKRQTEQASPPNSSPARLEGPLKKGAFSPLQSPESRTAHGVLSVGVNRKASSFTPSTNTHAKTRVARRPPATYTTATGAASLPSEKFGQGPSKSDGRTEISLTGGSASGTRTQQTQKEITHSERAQGEQQNVQREELCNEPSEDSEDDDEEGHYGSCDSDSSDAESPGTSPKEGHSEGEEDEQGQGTAKANPAVVEMDLDDADEEDCLEGELRYNMRTGKFSKAYVVRGAASHRILLRQRRTIVGSEKGSDPSWIFPWEVRPEVDVFAAAAAAATTSARRQQAPSSGHSGSARANARFSSHSCSPGKPSGRRLADGVCQRGKARLRQFQGRDAEADKLGDMMISERQKESVFDCLSKMAQANEWAQMMKINRNYRAFRTREGKLACHVYQGKSYIKRLPMEVFMSYEYPRLRRRFMLCCPYLHMQSQTAVIANANDTEVALRRELELQNVLLSTIQLTHALREQLDFVQRASNDFPHAQLR